MPEPNPGKDIIQNIRKTLKGRVDNVIGNAFKPEINSADYLPEFDDLPELIFARNLVRVGGKFSFCLDKKELLAGLADLYQEKKWEAIYTPEQSIKVLLDMAGIPNYSDMHRIKEMDAAVSACEYLIARTGSVMVSSAQIKERRMLGFAPIHIVIAYTSQLVNEIKDGIIGIRENYIKMPSMVSTITGPSRTADIEKTLVQGMHGPEELYVFLVNDK
ncbi:MAG: LUD domain-containing protein [Bacteroidetes bacterium]|jgi:L-lactate dehydrogenase complex protein LldG|nr:LUD domain-containing protein [Bacteroidota bacterium]MBT4400196.1 LUD domain-containing protein [Bacteroidota bacterium]MBT4408771.1 LUD domain-containing protein [Bacteroidota bacterium]MBT5426154.1 LUD domain-containing protein [Bacteroidota bacterium]MBT7094919.1 LUD domain-containing protein [Bacteroidota bacterium]